MKNIFLILITFPVLLFSQYNTERTTEQSFEQSDLYFKSYFLNTFGIGEFKNASVGFVNNPFLNLYLNPAYTPELKESILAYLDFRGDRKTPEIVESYVVPYYYDYMMRPYPQTDPRWLSSTRSEPEPIVSLGIITYPVKEVTDKLVLAGTYQLIHRNEKYYSVPYGIYNPRFMYDAFNEKVASQSAIPIIDRFSGKDEMMNEGHLYSLFLNYRFLDNLSLGIGLNGVSHSRTGSYLNSNRDDYNNIDNQVSENRNLQARDQDYHHMDINAGIMYSLTPKLNIGIKGGILNGNADQNYQQESYSQYTNNIPQVSSSWYQSYSFSSTAQNWKHDGKTTYFSVNFDRTVGEGKLIRGYYRYGKTKVELKDNSSIYDTSLYTSRYIYNSLIYDSYSVSSMRDNRTGTGERRKLSHEGALNFNWALTAKSNFTIGLYFSSYKETVSSSEPVNAFRMSRYRYTQFQPDTIYNNFTTLAEDKTLEWEYSMKYWTIQIPVMIQFKITDYLGLMLGVNRVLSDWEINDRTTAIFSIRERVENGAIKREANFGERYTQPANKMTDNSTDFISRFDISISNALNIHLWLDPNFEDIVSISQWWISFEAEL